MTYFYKGVGVGTFLHATDLRTTGIAPARPTLSFSLSAAMLHVSSGVVMSPCISVTRSYAVAEDYARYAGLTAPTLAKPAHVYVIEIPDPLPTGIAIHDPVEYVASHNRNPLASPSYHHNGDAKFLLAVVDPASHLGRLTTPPARPPGMAGGVPSGPIVTSELHTMVNSLRDAEILIVGIVHPAWVIQRFDIR
jgi:hypothetical protein